MPFSENYLASGLTITNGGATATLTFDSDSTVGDLLTRINKADAGVLAQIKQDQLQRAGKELMTEEQQAAFKQPTIDLYEFEGSPYYSTARLWDDGVLKLEDTRAALALGLSAALNAPIPEMRMGVIRM